MRRILVVHARTHASAKRGGGRAKVTLTEALAVFRESEPLLLDLDEALDRLAAQDARKGRVVDLTFLGGLKLEEVAEVLGISVPKVQRDLRQATAWFYRELE